MTNEDKARDIQSKDPCQVWIGGCPNVYAAAMAMADFKDTQPISELGGWHTEPPTEDGCYLVESTTIPYKNSAYLVAEYDTNAECWYDEAFENSIKIIRWKKIWQ